MNRKQSVQGDFAKMRSDYRMSKTTRFQSQMTGVQSLGSGADYHYKTEFEWLRMIERGRFYQREDCVVGQGVNRLCSNVVQEGFKVDQATGDEELDKDIRQAWQEFAEDADAFDKEGELTFADSEPMILSSVIFDGDTFALPLESGRLQFVEAHRCRTPSNTKLDVVHGIELEPGSGRRLRYWFTKEELGLNARLSRVSDVKKYDARDSTGNRQVFHVYNPKRFSQRRGVSACAPISEMIGIHDDLEFATLVKAQLAALIAVIHEQKDSITAGSGFGDAIGQETIETLNGTVRSLDGVAAGMEIFARPGETIKTFSSDVPSPGFKEHAMMVLQFIAINLDLPLIVLLLDATATNFSGWRGAIDQAKLSWRRIQQWLIRKYHRPVYLWRLRWLLANDASFRGAVMRSGKNPALHRWNAPGWPYVQPLQDATADTLQLSSSLNSMRRVQNNRGREWDDVSREIIEDNVKHFRRAIVAARELNQEFEADLAEPIDFRELMSLVGVKGVDLAKITSEGVANDGN